MIERIKTEGQGHDDGEITITPDLLEELEEDEEIEPWDMDNTIADTLIGEEFEGVVQGDEDETTPVEQWELQSLVDYVEDYGIRVSAKFVPRADLENLVRNHLKDTNTDQPK